MVERSPSLLLRSLRTAATRFRAAEGAVTTASRWRVGAEASAHVKQLGELVGAEELQLLEIRARRDDDVR
jgi:hypothetical protein